MNYGSPGRELHFIFPDSRILSCILIILTSRVKFRTPKAGITPGYNVQ